MKLLRNWGVIDKITPTTPQIPSCNPTKQHNNYLLTKPLAPPFHKYTPVDETFFYCGKSSFILVRLKLHYKTPNSLADNCLLISERLVVVEKGVGVGL